MSDGAGVAESAALRRVRGGGGRRDRSALGWLTIVPLLIFTVLLYNLIVVFSGFSLESAQKVITLMTSPAFTLPMASNAEWTVAWGDLLVIISLVLLFMELLKSTGSGSLEIFNHALSMLLFIVCLIEFLLAPGFATSTFFVIMLMTLLDVLAGVIVTINSARRDIGVEQ